MAFSEQTGIRARAAIGVGGAVAVAAVATVAWWFAREAPQAAVPAPLAALPEAVAPAPVPVPETVAVPVAPEPPTFDLVRVDADGAAQVAGRGEPASRILLNVDGGQVAETDVALDGAFLVLFTLAPNPKPSLLSLMMVMPDGVQIPGRDTVALAPIAGPVVVADVAPAAPVAEAPDVAEVAPPAALLVTKEAVEVLQAPVVVGAVTIDTISYTDDGAVQFGGRGEARQLVRLYLDNAALAEVPVAAGGQWGVTKSDIAPGLYTLRADQLDAEGKVTSRFETPFKRETLVALAEAVAPAAEPPVFEAEPDVDVSVVASVVAAPETITPEAPASEPAAPEAPAPEVVAAPVAAPDAAPPAGAPPDVVAAAGPAAVESPSPLATPPLAAQPPVVQAPAKRPEVEATAPSQTADAAAPATAPDSVAAALEPAPAVVAAVPEGTAPAADAAPASVASPVSITVQPGLTLWAIAEANFGEGIRYVQVYEANKDKITDPDLIYPGQVFTVPAEP